MNVNGIGWFVHELHEPDSGVIRGSLRPRDMTLRRVETKSSGRSAARYNYHDSCINLCI